MEDSAVMDDTAAPGTPASTPATMQPQSPGRAPLVPEGRLAAAVEAILLTHDRPLTAIRLAEAMGLAPRSADGGGDPEGPADQVQGGQEGAGQGKRRRKGPGPESFTAAMKIDAAVKSLNEEYERGGRSFRIEAVAGGYRVMTLPEFAVVLTQFQKARVSGRLSRAAVETLAIIAYKQPLTRAHLEAIRGVACGEVLRSLLDRRLITIKGRAEELGRPILYGTTKEFLDAFGLASLKDLPTAAELSGSI
jgi:segregation and condensation protein B